MNAVLKSYRAPVIAALLACFAGSALAGQVVIIEGTDTTRNKFLHDIGDRAQKNYEALGYTVKRLPNTGGPVKKADALAAINAPGVNAVFFAGHGGSVNGNPAAWITLDYPSGGAADKTLRPADLTGNYNGIKHVEIQACGQDLQAWKDAFPKANLDAWKKTINGDQMKNDVTFGSPKRIPAKAPPPPAEPPPIYYAKTSLDPRFEMVALTTPSMMLDSSSSAFFSHYNELGFQMSPSVLTQFGGAMRTFQVQSTEDMTDYLPLHQLTVANGVCVADEQDSDLFSTPAFKLTFNPDALEACYENFDLCGTMFQTGNAWIENNTTGLPDQVCFDAAAAVYFGYNASLVPTPGSGLLAGIAGVLALRRRR